MTGEAVRHPSTRHARDLQITAIGFGAWAIGGADYAFGWGPQDDNDSVGRHSPGRRRRHQLDRHGAPSTASAAPSEVVARALKELGSSRRPYVFTKCSLVWDDAGQIIATR